MYLSDYSETIIVKNVLKSLIILFLVIIVVHCRSIIDMQGSKKKV